MNKLKNGALIDTRPEVEKQKDYRFEEIVTNANPVNWIEKPQSEWRKFPIFNQDGSGSCVAQTLAKLLGILYWLKNQENMKNFVMFSAAHIYQQRYNKPGGGMSGTDAFKIAQNGVTLEELVPSQGMTDEQMDKIEIPQYKKDVGSVFKIPNYVSLPIGDIETIASTIQTTNKGVMVWFFFNINEWTEKPEIKDNSITLNTSGVCRHSVTAIDFTLYQGKKSLIIEDSWGTNYGLVGQRIIDEDFFKARNWFAAYPIAFKFDDQTQPEPPKPQEKPKYTFTTDLQFGMTTNSVVWLQNILKYEGLFPINVESTGYFGSITKTAVMKFQDKYKISHVGRVGAITRKKLNELYG